MRRRRPLLVLGLLLLGATAPASALAADRFEPRRPPLITLEPRSDVPRAVVLDDGTVVVQYFHGEGDVQGGASRVDLCRISPGATGCDGTPLRIDPDDPLTDSALLQPDPTGEPDTLQSVTRRIDEGVLKQVVRTSTDGGRSFGPPRVVASNDRQLGGTWLAHGPGAFSFSTLASGRFQAAQYDAGGAPTTQVANLVPGADTRFEGLALANATTPVAIFDVEDPDGRRRFVTRRFSGTGAVNDAAAWTPPVSFDPPKGVFRIVGSAGGPRGAFAGWVERSATGCGPQFVVARYEGDSFAPPVSVDPVQHAAGGVDCDHGDPIAPGAPVAFGQDPGGSLHALWSFRRLNTDPVLPDGLYSTASVDGGRSWTQPIRLFLPEEPGAELNVPNQALGGIAANADGVAVALGRNRGDGAQVLRLPSVSDALAQPGPAPAPAPAPAPGAPPGTPPPPPPPPPPPSSSACSTVRFGAVRALATVGCWTRRGTLAGSTGPVRINGIDLTPSGAGARVELDSREGTVTTTGTWRASASAIQLGTQAIRWRVPAGGGQVLDAVTGQPARLDASGGGQRVLGLPVSGLVLPRFSTDGTAQLPMNLQLPAPLGGLTGGPLTDDVTLTTDNGVGVRLARGAVSIELPTVSLGLAEISPFKVTYQADPFVFTGELGIKLPVVGGGIRGSFLLRDGAFVDATAEYSPPPPGIPVTGFAYLTKVGLHVRKGQACDDPTKVEVNGTMTAGPKVSGDLALLAVRGSASYALPEGSCGRPGVFRIQGDGELVSIGVANVFVQYVTDGTLTFGASATLGSASTGVSGSIDGAIAFATGDFFARGTFSVKVAKYELGKAEAIVGTEGIGACAKLDPLPPIGALLPIEGGVKVRWDEGLTLYAGNCDISDLVPARFRPAQAGGAAAVPVLDGTRAQTFTARGADRAPQYVLVGPDGSRRTTATPEEAVRTAGGTTAFTDDGLRQASITVRAPRTGTWRLEPLPGSVPLLGVEGAAGGEAPRVTARVTRIGGSRFALRYDARLPRGARVTFLDTTGQRLGRARQGEGAGTIRFTSATGRRGLRRVVARVDGELGPIRAPVVARFTSPGAPRLGRPSRVRLTRGRGRAMPGLRVAWRRASGARRYVVRVVLRDGRRLELPTSARQRSVVVPRVPAFDTARVEVRAVAADRRVGPAAVARLKARPVARRRR